MTPLGCPDCLLIRYEPRALRARFRAHAIAFVFPGQACVARFFAVTFFLELLLFFRMCESRAFVASWLRIKPTMSGYEILDDIMISFEYRTSFPSSLR